MAQTINVSLVALSVIVSLVNAGLIGSCDKSIISTIMKENSYHCPSKFLHLVYNQSPTVVFRVLPKVLADRAKCIMGVLQEPTDNIFDFETIARFKNESWPSLETTFVMAETRCGLTFKYVVEENYSSFKMAFSYFDGITLGYYGCSDDAQEKSDDFNYVVCLSVVNVDEDLTTASVKKCKDHMAAITGATDLTELDINKCAEYL